MPAHNITVTYKAKKFTYVENGKDARTIHVLHGDTLTWVRSDGGALSIVFKKGDPTREQSPPYHEGRTVTLVGHSGEPKNTQYLYSVTANGDTDDPVIIFDDAGLELENRQDLNTIMRSATTAWQGVLEELAKEAKTQSGSNQPLFFPFGITSISVTVTVPPVTLEVAVSGPQSAGKTENVSGG